MTYLGDQFKCSQKNKQLDFVANSESENRKPQNVCCGSLA